MDYKETSEKMPVRSASAVIRKMQIKSTVSDHYTLMRMPTVLKWCQFWVLGKQRKIEPYLSP